MKIQTITNSALAMVILLWAGTGITAAPDYRDSVVKITVTAQPFDYNAPWYKGAVVKKSLYGVVTAKKRIIAEATMLADHVLIEASKHGSNKKYTARVILKDYHRGVALITVDETGFFDDIAPAEIIDYSNIEGKAGSVVNWDESGNIKRYSARYIKSSLRLFQPYSSVLVHHMATDIDAAGGGEPVFIDGKLAGITAWYSADTKTLNVIAADILRLIIRDLDDDGTYKGFPYFYLDTDLIQSDENLRRHLGLNPDQTGVLVTRVPSRTSGAAEIRPGDVIMSINGHRIDDNGLYRSPAFGKLHFTGLINLTGKVGDTLTLDIVRDKKPLTIKFTLAPFAGSSLLIPMIHYDTAPNYVISGGLIFQELTQGLLKTWGAEWRKQANRRFLYYFEGMAAMPSTSADRIIVLNRVLPASVNQGYHDLNNMVLKAVNGVHVRNMRHLQTLIRSATGRFLKYDFAGSVSIVLDRAEVAASDRSIWEKYNVAKGSFIGTE